MLKFFIVFFENEMVFKLSGETHKMALSLDGSKLFDKSARNRPMKEWVQEPFNYVNEWLEFADAAFKYVSKI